MHKLKLYISGDSSVSQIAHTNLVTTCNEVFGDAYDLELIDVLEHPQVAVEAGVRCTPTVVREEPAPERMALGNLSDRARLLRVLGAEPKRPRLLLPTPAEHGHTRELPPRAEATACDRRSRQSPSTGQSARSTATA